MKFTKPGDFNDVLIAWFTKVAHGLSWALAELTWRRPFVDTGRLVIIRRKLPSDQVTDEFGKEFLLLCVL